MTTTVTANGIELAYELSGAGPPLLLVMGLGGQLTDWHPGFVAELERHFTVIRYDNRDSGLSTHIAGKIPSKWDVIKASVLGPRASLPYYLDDLADDAAALVDALDIGAAHVVGMSMGGMVAQLLTLRHPHKVLSLCSIMSNTGDRFTGRPSTRVLFSLARRGRPSKDQAVDVTMDLLRLVGGPDWDPEEQRRRTTASVARAYNPGGVLRQSMAIAAATNRTQRLKNISAPTVVIHGLDDPLVRPSGGSATAEAIPNARLLLFPGMGHDLPATRHEEMADAIVANSKRAAPPASL